MGCTASIVWLNYLKMHQFGAHDFDGAHFLEEKVFFRDGTRAKFSYLIDFIQQK